MLLFTLPSKGRRKKQGGNYGQIFPKIVHQKIIIVFEMQYSFCQTLNAIQTNIKESKAFKRMKDENNETMTKFSEESDYSVVHIFVPFSFT